MSACQGCPLPWAALSWRLDPLLRAVSRADRPEGSCQGEQAGAALTPHHPHHPRPGVAPLQPCELRQDPSERFGVLPKPRSRRAPPLARLLGGVTALPV